MAKDKHFEEISARWERFAELVRQGDELVKAENWRAAYDGISTGAGTKARRPARGRAA